MNLIYEEALHTSVMRGYVEAMVGGLRTETVYPIPPIDVFDLTPQKIKLQNSCSLQ